MLLEALAPLAGIPDVYLYNHHADTPLMGWSDHRIYTRDVLAARAAIQAIEADMPESFGMTLKEI